MIAGVSAKALSVAPVVMKIGSNPDRFAISECCAAVFQGNWVLSSLSRSLLFSLALSGQRVRASRSPNPVIVRRLLQQQVLPGPQRIWAVQISIFSRIPPQLALHLRSLCSMASRPKTMCVRPNRPYLVAGRTSSIRKWRSFYPPRRYMPILFVI